LSLTPSRRGFVEGFWREGERHFMIEYENFITAGKRISVIEAAIRLWISVSNAAIPCLILTNT
jgi:hypothetical protein